MSTLRTLKTRNVDNLKVAAKIEAGKVVNQNLAKVVSPLLPESVRGYASHPLGQLVLANVLEAVAINVPSLQSNDKVRLVTEAAMLSATTESVASFGLAQLLNDNIDKVFAGVNFGGQK